MILAGRQKDLVQKMQTRNSIMHKSIGLTLLELYTSYNNDIYYSHRRFGETGTVLSVSVVIMMISLFYAGSVAAVPLFYGGCRSKFDEAVGTLSLDDPNSLQQGMRFRRAIHAIVLVAFELVLLLRLLLLSSSSSRFHWISRYCIEFCVFSCIDFGC